MEIKLNKQNVTSNGDMNMITFNHIPTILSVKGSVGNGYTSYELTILPCEDATGIEIIQFGNSTLRATNNITEAVNNIFYMSSSATPSLMAYYLVNALNSTIESISYNIYSINEKVFIVSKEIGHPLDTLLTTAIGFFTLKTNSSTTKNELDGSKIIVNIFSNTQFVASLVKTAINSECKFDLSPILVANTKDGKLFDYNLKISQLTNTDNLNIANLNRLFAVNGYSVNQGKYDFSLLDSNNDFYVMQNVSKGTDKDVYNNTILYCSEPEIIISLSNILNNDLPSITVKYLDSVYTEIATETFNSFISDNRMYNCKLNLNKKNFDASSYIDVILPNNNIIRYNIIKPLRYNSKTYRVYWYNSYGGISFFDFTGLKTEERKSEKVTYKKSNLTIYEDDEKSLDKVYSNTLEYTVTLTTHMLEKDGIYSLYDLLNSYHAWIVVNDEKNEIIITDMQIKETQNNNIYQGEIKFTYSSNDMF